VRQAKVACDGYIGAKIDLSEVDGARISPYMDFAEGSKMKATDNTCEHAVLVRFLLSLSLSLSLSNTIL